MSDLCDELYKENFSIDPGESEIESNKVVKFNNEKRDLKNTKKRIIIKLKIFNTKSDNSGIEHPASIEILNRKSYDNKFLEHFESKTSGRTYTIELIECANILPELDYNENSLIDGHKRLYENDTKTMTQDKIIVPKKFNYDSNENEIINIDATTHIVEDLYKREYNETFLNKVEILNVKSVQETIDETSSNTLPTKNEVQGENYRIYVIDIKKDEDDSNCETNNNMGENQTHIVKNIFKSVEKELDSSVYREEKHEIKDNKNSSTLELNIGAWPKLSKRNTNKQEKDKINSFTVKQNKFPKHCLSNEETTKDSLIIKDIVMKKYEATLRQFKQRSLRRRQTRHRRSLSDEKELKQKPTRPTSLDIKYLHCNQDSQLDTKTPDSGLGATQELDLSNCKSSESFQSSNQSLKYSPTTFLKEALGDEYINVTCDSERASTPKPNNERSIGSSEISTLMSTIDGVDSLYSTVDKTRKKRSSVLKKTLVRPLFYSTSSDTYIYESIEKFKINPKTEELNTGISVQSAIIAQASKALSLCRQSPVFFGSIPHLEAEKYLLFATYKKIILENQLNREYEEMESEQCYGTVNVENLKFILNTGNTTDIDNVGQYYMCLLYSDATLLASNIVVPEKNGQIIFKQSFQFSNLTSDFVIYIKMFSMVLENKHKKRLYLSQSKIHSNRKHGIYKKHVERLSEMSSFRLLGTSKLCVSDVYKSNSLYLEKVSLNGRISDTFTADIRSSINITNNVKGFLTIGTTNVLWNRRWCVLQGPFLKYWNYPSDDNVIEPIGMFDLSDCVCHRVTNVDKTLCSRSRTVMLQIKSEECETVRQYFLQADNSVEFEEWKRQLNSVLISLTNWKCLKTLT